MIWTLFDPAVSFLIFGLLARVSPCNPGQHAFFSRDQADNILYWFLGVFVLGNLGALYVHWIGLAFGAGAPAVTAAIQQGYGAAARLPLWAQAALVIVLMDFVQYWLHRLFHGHTLWPFHAIHHSAEELEWTTTFRIHPVNFALYAAGAATLIQLLGFSPAAFLVIAPFNLVIGPLVHANLDWTFGPFRYVLVSPVYHRWHHVRDPAIYNRNFAPTFPVFDLMFGTFYMPRGELPQSYGVDGVPPHFFGQLIYPFRTIAERIARPRKAGEATA